MAPTPQQHRRTHNILLISKLLNQRDAASPFTLLLDTLEQSAKPLVAECLKRAEVRVRLGVILPDAQKSSALIYGTGCQCTNDICVV